MFFQMPTLCFNYSVNTRKKPWPKIVFSNEDRYVTTSVVTSAVRLVRCHPALSQATTVQRERAWRETSARHTWTLMERHICSQHLRLLVHHGCRVPQPQAWSLIRKSCSWAPDQLRRRRAKLIMCCSPQGKRNMWITDTQQALITDFFSLVLPQSLQS